MIGLLSLSEIYHDGQTTSTGIGKKIREIELEEYRNLARSWRDLNGKDSVKMIGGEERRIIWAYIDADRWASALKSCEYDGRFEGAGGQVVGEGGFAFLRFQ